MNKQNYSLAERMQLVEQNNGNGVNTPITHAELRQLSRDLKGRSFVLVTGQYPNRRERRSKPVVDNNRHLVGGARVRPQYAKWLQALGKTIVNQPNAQA